MGNNTEMQSEILAALNAKDGAAGEMFEGALTVLSIETIPNRIALCAHSLRELMTRLPSILDVPTPARDESLTNRVSRLREECSNLSGGMPARNQKREDLFNEFFEWFDTHQPRRREEAVEILNALDISRRALPMQLTALNVNDWEKLRDHFNAIAHGRREALDNFILKVRAFETHLHQYLVPRTFEDFKIIDDLIAQAGTEVVSANIVSKIIALIRIRNANYEHFFSSISSVNWLAPLRDAGFFSNPPSKITEGESTRFPVWLQSRYLATVAGQNAAQVMKVIRSIETDNTRIHEDFVDAILQVSPKWAAQWAAKEVLWIEQQSYLYFLYPTKIGALIQRLAENGHANAALALARAILDMPHRETFVAFGRARIETWAYEKILTERIPFLVRKSGAPSLTMLCNTFETTLHTSYTLGTSYFWRATIAAHEMNFSDKSMRHALVDAIRASAIDMMWEGKGQDMVDLLFQRGPALYRRVAFHAVVAVPKLEANLEASLVMNEATFQDDTNYPEYGLLLRQTFPKLNPSQQAVVLSWIADGPLTNEADSLAVDVTGERHERWQHQRLWCIKDSLTGELSAALSDLNEKYGEPVDRVERPTSRGYEVDVSPISLEDLSKMSPADVANFLLEWVPSGERYSPSVKGLANELERAVARSPQPYADALSRFVGVRSRYTCAIINGFQEARRKQPTFNAVIALGFLSQQVTSARSEEQQTINEDDKWYCVWSRIQVGQLIATLLDDNRVEFADRDQVWTLITQLIEDEHPTSGDDESSANGEAIHNSWNCVRGSAMHAVLPYANWVRQNMLRTEPQTWQADLGLGQMQEVQLLLERLLDTSIEPSPSVRAVYGYALAFFNIVDTGWVTEHLNTIFSDDDASLHEAAWRAYLGSPFRRSGAFRLTRALYVSTLDNTTNYSGYTERVTEQLGLDIMMAFANGIVDFNDTDQIIERYFSSVPAEHIAHAITKMGNLLSGEENVPVDIATRYERLWSYYNQRVGPSLEANAVAQTFDPWFSCPHLNANWAFHEMRGLLSRSPTDFGRLHSTMGRLAQLAPTFPAECLSILENIATCDVQGWAVFGAREEIRTIIKAGLSVEATRQIAIRVVHVLGALGEEHLGDLLENTDSLIVL